MTASAYTHYDSWKGWTRPFRFDEDDAAYFKKEFGRFELAGRKVLEIGYGEGRFLSWAASKGAKLYGTELVPAMRTAAVQFGVTLLSERLTDALEDHAASFDLIVALDVVEHWSHAELMLNLTALEALLRPGAYLIMRFPNGQSPFGLAPQTSDPTHRIALSQDYFQSILAHLPAIEVIRYGPQARHLGRRPLRALKRFLRYSARTLITAALNFVYATNIPWDAVVTLVLRRRDLPSI
jgi:2-polyprenyl-3-methyl-5-hydroxy-6-metoxy-1,4-benzoquinol methylase